MRLKSNLGPTGADRGTHTCTNGHKEKRQGDGGVLTEAARVVKMTTVLTRRKQKLAPHAATLTQSQQREGCDSLSLAAEYRCVSILGTLRLQTPSIF